MSYLKLKVINQIEVFKITLNLEKSVFYVEYQLKDGQWRVTLEA